MSDQIYGGPLRGEKEIEPSEDAKFRRLGKPLMCASEGSRRAVPTVPQKIRVISV
jgi:hypothetical protein